MWWTVIFTIAALCSVKALQELRPLTVDPSAISNIELLIPLTVSRVETREFDGEDSDEDLRVDRDEPYSAIPGYAFTLDRDSLPGSDRAVYAFPSSSQPELIPHHSWYLSNAHQREQDTRTKKQVSHIRSEEVVDGETMEILRACKPLAAQAQRHASPEARKALQFLCIELAQMLRSRCDCCKKKKYKPRSATSMSWFQTIDNKRRDKNTQAVDDIQEDV